MSKARDLARLQPDFSGQLPAANIADAAITAAKLAANGVWAPSGTVIAVNTVRSSTRTSMPYSNNFTAFSGSFNKLRSDSVIVATATVFGSSFDSGNCGTGLRLNNTWDFGSAYQYDGAWTQALQTTIAIGTGRWTGVPAGTHTMGWGWQTADGATGNRPFQWLNPSSAGGDARVQQMTSSIVIYEVAP